MNVWIRTGLVLALGAALTGCSAEGSRVALNEMERVKRETDKQMRLVKEQNLTLNEKLNRINERLDIIENEYIPAVNASLDSVTAREQGFKSDLVMEVEGRLSEMNDNVRALKNELSREVMMQGKAVTDQVRDNLDEVQFRVSDLEAFVQFVASRQDSVNQAMIDRVDRKAGYTSFFTRWAGQSDGVEISGPSF